MGSKQVARERETGRERRVEQRIVMAGILGRVENAIAGANHCFRRELIGQTETRAEIVEVGLSQGAVLQAAGFRQNDAVGADIEIRHAICGLGYRRRVLIAETDVHGQPAGHFPVVLQEGAVVADAGPSAHVGSDGGAVGITEQEVGEGVSGSRSITGILRKDAIVGKRTARGTALPKIKLRAAMVEPGLEGVASGDEGHVIEHLVDVLPATRVEAIAERGEARDADYRETIGLAVVRAPPYTPPRVATFGSADPGDW